MHPAIRVIAGVLLSAGLAISVNSAVAETINFAHVAEPSDPRHKAMVAAADSLKAKTDGKYEMKVFPASQLGGEKEITEAVGLGIVDAVFSGVAFVGEKYPPFAAMGAPYMFRSYDHFVAFTESPLFAEMAADYEAETGDHVAGLIYTGARQVTANWEIETPADMNGMKLRVPQAPLYMMFAEAVEANATPIPFAEVYLALQQGVVEGQENPLTNIFAKKFYEVQSHVILTEHMTEASIIIIGQHLWGKLNDEEKAIFDEVFAKAAADASAGIRKSEVELADWFKEQGLTVVTPDRVAFQAAAKPLLTSDDVPWSSELFDQIQAIQE
ncbi:sialic acid TRAP transporter substrate-binding protein SiaP [Rhodospirillaceae bacterium SYSU D60014]|uniref:sialic acid TRAP transporter substrate-binding protein SiaP n=1 Tax=Virgifigura deserti TaxID=2268457 RepID=UPI0013C50DA8